jgi:hypothetical protein
MKPFSELSAEELAMENLFIRWVRFPDDPPIRSFWEGWIVKYPAMKETVAKARELVLMASDWKTDTLSSQEINSIWGRIRSSLDMIKEREPAQAAGNVYKEPNEPSGIVLGLISMAVIILLVFVFFSLMS